MVVLSKTSLAQPGLLSSTPNTLLLPACTRVVERQMLGWSIVGRDFAKLFSWGLCEDSSTPASMYPSHGNVRMSQVGDG